MNDVIWPVLVYPTWSENAATLQPWLQILGKVRGAWNRPALECPICIPVHVHRI